MYAVSGVWECSVALRFIPIWAPYGAIKDREAMLVHARDMGNQVFVVSSSGGLPSCDSRSERRAKGNGGPAGHRHDRDHIALNRRDKSSWRIWGSCPSGSCEAAY